jgi:hypothetical protein
LIASGQHSSPVWTGRRQLEGWHLGCDLAFALNSEILTGMQGMMGSGMRGPGMMQGGMGAGMMQGGMTPMQGGMGAIFGSRVTPMMSLSIDDVRGYLAVQLDRLNNKRLKVGDVRSDDGTITADIVTVDNSLVQRLKVDRHTGAIDYQD